MDGYENRDMFRNSFIQEFNTYEKASLEREAAVPINLLIAYVYRQDLMLFDFLPANQLYVSDFFTEFMSQF